MQTSATSDPTSGPLSIPTSELVRTSWALEITSDWAGNPLRSASGLDTPGSRRERCRVELTLEGERCIVSISSPYHRDPAPPGAIGPTPGLWNYEVVELFIAEAYPGGANPAGANPASNSDDVSYTEFEFSPHGHWLAWRFSGVRRRLEGGDPTVHYRAWSADGRWHGRATFEREALPAAPWRLYATAVHGAPPRRCFEASAPLPGDEPDFHQPGAYPLADDHRISKRPLEDAYRTTRYVVGSDGNEGNDGNSTTGVPLEFRVGAMSTAAEEKLLTAEGSDQWAFITAYNPHSQARAETLNRAAQELLRQTLDGRGYRLHQGQGVPDGSIWPPEPSFFVPGLSPAEALGLAREFDQAAVLVGRRGQPSRLLWTTP